MEQINYKDEIRDSRTGSLGSSDGKLIAQISALGTVPKSAYKRLAVCKGLVPHVDIPQTAAIKAGDDIEMMVYEYLRATDERWQSNPCLVSEKYSRPNCRLISHVDFMLEDDDEKILYLVECKASKHPFPVVRDTYKDQLFVHYMLGKEHASKLGKGWKVKLSLCVYNTDGLDLEDGIIFDPSRLMVKQVNVGRYRIDLRKAMDIINDFLEGFTEYYGDGEEIPYEILPANVKNQFLSIVNTLKSINEQKKTVDEFNQRLYQFMLDNDIKKIKNDMFSISRVDASESHSFDYKKYLDDERVKHPLKTKKLEEKYEKVTKRNGYAKFTIKDEK